MGRKIGIIVVALILGVAFAGELMVLSAQKTEQTSDAQTESVQNALPVQGTEQTTNTQTERAQNKLPAETTPNSAGRGNNSQIDATKQNNSTGGRINYLHVCLSLGGIGTFLFGLTALLKFIRKARSKNSLRDMGVHTDNSNVAEKLDKILKLVEQNSKSSLSLIEKVITEAYMLEEKEKIVNKRIKTTEVTFQGRVGTYKFEVYPLDTSFNATGAIYIFAKYAPDQYGTGTYTPLYIGQTISLRNRILEHRHHGKWICVENYGVNCICVHRDTDARSRMEKEADLLVANEPPCNERYLNQLQS